MVIRCRLHVTFFSRYKYVAHSHPAVTFGRGDKSYSAHCCLRKAWEACLEAYLSSDTLRFSAVTNMSRILIRQLRLVGGISLTRRTAVLERRGKPVLKPICQAPRKLSGAPGGLVWPARSFPVGLEVVWSASCRCRERQKGCLERQDGCLERKEGCLEGQEGLSGRPGAPLAVLQAVGSALKAVWSAWRYENVGRSDVLE